MNSLEKLKTLARRNAVFPFTLPLTLRFDDSGRFSLAAKELLLTTGPHPHMGNTRLEHIAEVRFGMNDSNTAECISFHKKDDDAHSVRYRLDALLPGTLYRLAARFAGSETFAPVSPERTVPKFDELRAGELEALAVLLERLRSLNRGTDFLGNARVCIDMAARLSVGPGNFVGWLEEKNLAERAGESR